MADVVTAVESVHVILRTCTLVSFQDYLTNQCLLMELLNFPAHVVIAPFAVRIKNFIAKLVSVHHVLSA